MEGCSTPRIAVVLLQQLQRAPQPRLTSALAPCPAANRSARCRRGHSPPPPLRSAALRSVPLPPDAEERGAAERSARIAQVRSGRAAPTPRRWSSGAAQGCGGTEPRNALRRRRGVAFISPHPISAASRCGWAQRPPREPSQCALRNERAAACFPLAKPPCGFREQRKPEVCGSAGLQPFPFLEGKQIVLAFLLTSLEDGSTKCPHQSRDRPMLPQDLGERLQSESCWDPSARIPLRADNSRVWLF